MIDVDAVLAELDPHGAVWEPGTLDKRLDRNLLIAASEIIERMVLARAIDEVDGLIWPHETSWEWDRAIDAAVAALKGLVESRNDTGVV